MNEVILPGANAVQKTTAEIYFFRPSQLLFVKKIK